MISPMFTNNSHVWRVTKTQLPLPPQYQFDPAAAAFAAQQHAFLQAQQVQASQLLSPIRPAKTLEDLDREAKEEMSALERLDLSVLPDDRRERLVASFRERVGMISVSSL